MPIGQKVIKSFKASLDDLYPMLGLIKSYAESMGFEEKELSHIELAAEEALVNIIEYAYLDKDDGVIEIFLSGRNNEEFRMQFTDEGIPFNPLSNSKKFRVKSFKTNPTIGGYGTYFIIELMDRVEYERRGNANILTLIKAKRLPGRT